MKEKRSLFEKIFGGKKQKTETYEICKLLNSWQTRFTPFSGNAYAEAQVRTAVHTFAKRVACVKVRHIKRNLEKETVEDVPYSPVCRLLNTRANPTAIAYKFFYRAATHYKLYNNAFLYPVYEYNEFTRSEELTAVYNINADAIELVEYENEIFCLFEFYNTGDRYVVPYVDVIHIAAHCNKNDIFGENNAPINGTLKLGHSLKQSVEKYAELIQVLRGILVVKNAVTKDADLADARDKFIENNLAMDADTGGIVVTDGKYEYKPLDNKETPIPVEQLKFVKEEVFEYYGVNENIVKNTSTAEEETAYYNGEMLPFFLQLEQAFTYCFCRLDGTEILCSSAQLKNAPIAEKRETVAALFNIGAMTVDEVRDAFWLSPFGGEEGKRRLQSLNYVAADKANKYQIGEENDTGGGEGTDDNKKEAQ